VLGRKKEGSKGWTGRGGDDHQPKSFFFKALATGTGRDREVKGNGCGIQMYKRSHRGGLRVAAQPKGNTFTAEKETGVAYNGGECYRKGACNQGAGCR